MSEEPIPAGLGHKLFILPKDAVVGIGEDLPPFTLREPDLHLDIKEEPLVKPVSFKLESWGNSASLPTQGLNDWLDSDEARKVTVMCFPSDSSLPRKMKKRRKLLLEMRLKGVSVDGKWVVFANQSGMVAQFPVHSSRLLARLRREENRIRKGGGRKYVFNQK